MIGIIMQFKELNTFKSLKKGNNVLMFLYHAKKLILLL